MQLVLARRECNALDEMVGMSVGNRYIACVSENGIVDLYDRSNLYKVSRFSCGMSDVVSVECAGESVIICSLSDGICKIDTKTFSVRRNKKEGAWRVYAQNQNILSIYSLVEGGSEVYIDNKLEYRCVDSIFTAVFGRDTTEMVIGLNTGQVRHIKNGKTQSAYTLQERTPYHTRNTLEENTYHSSSVSVPSCICHFIGSEYCIGTTDGYIYVIDIEQKGIKQVIKVRESSINGIVKVKESIFASGADSRIIRYAKRGAYFVKNTQDDTHIIDICSIQAVDSLVYTLSIEGTITIHEFPPIGEMVYIRRHAELPGSISTRDKLFLSKGNEMKIQQIITTDHSSPETPTEQPEQETYQTEEIPSTTENTSPNTPNTINQDNTNKILKENPEIETDRTSASTIENRSTIRKEVSIRTVFKHITHSEILDTQVYNDDTCAIRTKEGVSLYKYNWNTLNVDLLAKLPGFSFYQKIIDTDLYIIQSIKGLLHLVIYSITDNTSRTFNLTVQRVDYLPHIEKISSNTLLFYGSGAGTFNMDTGVYSGVYSNDSIRFQSTTIRDNKIYMICYNNTRLKSYAYLNIYDLSLELLDSILLQIRYTSGIHVIDEYILIYTQKEMLKIPCSNLLATKYISVGHIIDNLQLVHRPDPLLICIHRPWSLIKQSLPPQVYKVKYGRR
ncbi:hypothetical protein NEOKW01_0084 [Nematocida sp. AWRm80]|nr:hypothetical protein NEOKW01_0084 [Nematocida sp. AWRm80]